MNWQLVLDAQAAFTVMLIELFDNEQLDEVNTALETCSEAYREAFMLWIKYNRPRHYPKQPGDDKVG